MWRPWQPGLPEEQDGGSPPESSREAWAALTWRLGPLTTNQEMIGALAKHPHALCSEHRARAPPSALLAREPMLRCQHFHKGSPLAVQKGRHVLHWGSLRAGEARHVSPH